MAGARRESAVFTVVVTGLVLLCAVPMTVLVALSGAPRTTVLAALLAAVPVGPLVACFLWLDRYEPEPRRLLAGGLLWGVFVATAIALLLEGVGGFVGGISDKRMLELGAPFTEEASKGLFLFLLLWWRRSELDGVLDGIVYAGLVGVGFAFTENILYLASAYNGSDNLGPGGVHALTGTFVLRCLASPFAHPLFTACTGVGVGIAVSSRRRSVRFLAPVVGYLCAVALHAMWNTATVFGPGNFVLGLPDPDGPDLPDGCGPRDLGTPVGGPDARRRPRRRGPPRPAPGHRHRLGRGPQRPSPQSGLCSSDGRTGRGAGDARLPASGHRARVPAQSLPARRTPTGLRRPGARLRFTHQSAPALDRVPGTGGTHPMTGPQAATTSGAQMVTALVRLRAALQGAVLPLELPGVEDHRAARLEMVDQLEDYVIPRIVTLEAPLLAVVGGSTGAGKSTLVNSLVGAVVTESGVLRPTTRSPVLVHNPADADWFGADRLLPDLERVSRPTHDPQALQLVALDVVPQGLAILDAPDIDSVEESNRHLAAQLLAAADLWLFVTSAARYADQVPWDFLRQAAERSAAVAIVLDRTPADAVETVATHLARMLAARGLKDSPLFTVHEVPLTEQELLPPRQVAEIQRWLTDLGADADARAADGAPGRSRGRSAP